MRKRDILWVSIFIPIFLTILCFEQALNLILTCTLIAIVVGLTWVAGAVAISTSFFWLPFCLILALADDSCAALEVYSPLRHAERTDHQITVGTSQEQDLEPRDPCLGAKVSKLSLSMRLYAFLAKCSLLGINSSFETIALMLNVKLNWEF